MLAYAANAPGNAERRSSPNAMLAIIAVHVAVVAGVISAKMDLPGRLRQPPIIVDTIPVPKPPPPPEPVVTHAQSQTHQTLTQPQIVLPLPDLQVIDPTPSRPIIDSWPGPTVDGPPRVDPAPAVRAGPKLLTPPSELKPPYPQAKLLAEEEATLKLRLTIDERGRVIAVEPIGRADPAFLDAARRHLIAHWRYKPASEGGRALSSTEVITLRFQLDG